MNITSTNGVKRPLRDQVFAIEKEMLKQPQLDLKVINYFCQGIYARELFIPKDTVLVGKIHKYANMNMLTKGRLKVLIGDEIIDVIPPYIVIAPAGTKRIAYAVEDSIWVTLHRTDETNVDKIEDHFIAQSENEWLEFCKSEPKLPLQWFGKIDFPPELLAKDASVKEE